MVNGRQAMVRDWRMRDGCRLPERSLLLSVVEGMIACDEEVKLP